MDHQGKSFLDLLLLLLCTTFKVFIEFVSIWLLFYVLFCFSYKACGMLSPWPGTEPASPAMEGEVLNSGPPGQSLSVIFRSIETRYYYLHLEEESHCDEKTCSLSISGVMQKEVLQTKLKHYIHLYNY